MVREGAREHLMNEGLFLTKDHVVAAGFLAVGIASIPLLRPGMMFGSYVDWPFHEWATEYYRRAWMQFTIPDAFNSEHAFGVPVPVFYGKILYALLGLMAVAFGSAAGLRV